MPVVWTAKINLPPLTTCAGILTLYASVQYEMGS